MMQAAADGLVPTGSRVHSVLPLLLSLAVMAIGGSGCASRAGNAEMPKAVTNSVGMVFTLIPAGTGLIGSPEGEKCRTEMYEWADIGTSKNASRDLRPRELSSELVRRPRINRIEPRQTVLFNRPFYLGVVEVANAQFRRFRASHRTAAPIGMSVPDVLMDPLMNMCVAREALAKLSVHSLNGDRQPVGNVSYDAAVAFCQWLNSLPAERQAGRTYRLPTEDEWEYACRAGTEGRFYWDDKSKIGAHANVADVTGREIWTTHLQFHEDDGFLVSAPVASYKPNAYGLYDMLGNVHELTSSELTYYDWKYGRGSSSCFVAKGGSWSSAEPVVRQAARLWLGFNAARYDVGFRVVLEVRDDSREPGPELQPDRFSEKRWGDEVATEPLFPDFYGEGPEQ